MEGLEFSGNTVIIVVGFLVAFVFCVRLVMKNDGGDGSRKEIEASLPGGSLRVKTEKKISSSGPPVSIPSSVDPINEKVIEQDMKEGGVGRVKKNFDLINIPLMLMDETRKNITWMNECAAEFYGFNDRPESIDIDTLFDKSKKYYPSENVWKMHKSKLIQFRNLEEDLTEHNNIFSTTFYKRSPDALCRFRTKNRIVSILFEWNASLGNWIILMPITYMDCETFNSKDLLEFLGAV